MRTNDIFTTTYSPGSDPLRFLMLDSIVGSCGEICKGKANLEDFVNNYMVNFFEECAK